MTAIGITGHQTIPPEALDYIVKGIRECVHSQAEPIRGYSSLASGADQLFAREVIATGGELVAIIPCRGYETTFSDGVALGVYEELITQSTETVTLDFTEPTEEAFLAAGKEVVGRSDVVIAVWDGLPARGRGGTADVEAHARSLGKDVRIVWPEGVHR